MFPQNTCSIKVLHSLQLLPLDASSIHPFVESGKVFWTLQPSWSRLIQSTCPFEGVQLACEECMEFPDVYEIQGVFGRPCRLVWGGGVYRQHMWKSPIQRLFLWTQSLQNHKKSSKTQNRVMCKLKTWMQKINLVLSLPKNTTCLYEHPSCSRWQAK